MIVGTVVVIGAGVVVVVLLSITVGRRTKVGKFNRTSAQHNGTEKKIHVQSKKTKHDTRLLSNQEYLKRQSC